MTAEQITAAIAIKQTRLAEYMEQEHKMLTDGVQSYGLGTRNIQRYSMTLPQVREAIEKLEKEISGLNKNLSGNGSRAARGVVPMDI